MLNVILCLFESSIRVFFKGDIVLPQAEQPCAWMNLLQQSWQFPENCPDTLTKLADRVDRRWPEEARRAFFGIVKDLEEFYRSGASEEMRKRRLLFNDEEIRRELEELAEIYAPKLGENFGSICLDSSGHLARFYNAEHYGRLNAHEILRVTQAEWDEFLKHQTDLIAEAGDKVYDWLDLEWFKSYAREGIVPSMVND